MVRSVMCAVCVGLVLTLVGSKVCRGDESSSYEHQQSLRMDSRVEQLEKEVAELKEPGGTKSDSTLSWRWDKGLKFESDDGNFKFKFGGRLMYDFGAITQDDENKAAYGDIENVGEFRRARLYLSGDIYKNVFFKVQYDFADGDADLKDAYIGVKGIPVLGHIRAGHQYEQYSLDELTSSKYSTFIERAMPNEAFAPSRNAGILVYNDLLDGKMTWAVGLFRDSDDYGTNAGDDGYAITGRLTGTPYMSEKGDKLMHLGVSYSHREPPGDMMRLRARPEWHGAERFVDTGTFATASADLLGLEGAVVLGPFDVRAEYYRACTDAGDFDGWYIQGAYWLTGEHSKYKASEAVFDRVSPKKNFDPVNGGWGAWQVAARYSTVNLNDGMVSGGECDNVTLGLNWHLNPNTRVMFNWIHSTPDDAGDADIALVRFQIDF